MGSKQTNVTNSNNKNKDECKGGFGKVWKVNYKKTKNLFALKEMSKSKIIDKKSEKSIKYEKELLCRLKHPFIVNMQFAFQDYENLYLVMDLLNGGDLRYHISRHKKFSEEQTRFFVACLLLGLEYIHNNNVLHRDIKPENLVLDERGYVRITDFGIAKVYQKDNSSETSGTPGYMSPEVMCGQNHTIAVDYFAVGVLAYEFMNGRLLQRKPGNRIGLRGAAEVKDHSWLKYYPWKELYEKKLEAPFIPKIGDNFDKKYCETPDKIGNDTRERYDKYIREENFQIIFKNFTINNYNIEEQPQKETKENKTKHLRASSVSVSGSNLISNNNNNTNNNNYNINNNTILKSKIKIVEKDKRASSSMGGNLRNSVGTFHKQTQSYNNIYGSLIQKNNNFNNKNIEKSTEKKSAPILPESKAFRMPPGNLPNINNIDKLKLRKLISSSSSNMLLKYYKQNSMNSNNSTGATLTNQIFGKKTASYTNLNQ